MLLTTIKQVVKAVTICQIPIFKKIQVNYPKTRPDIWIFEKTFGTKLGRLTLRFNKQWRTLQSGNHYLLKSFGYGRDRTHPSSQVTYHPTIDSNQAEKFSILKQNDVFIIGKRCSFTAVNKIFQYKVL